MFESQFTELWYDFIKDIKKYEFYIKNTYKIRKCIFITS